jgi:hypothetical protein
MTNTVPQDDSDASVDTHFDPNEAEQVNHSLEIRGERVERIITTRDFLPPDDPQFAARLGVEPRGTRVLLGSLRGVVNSTERRTANWQGKLLESVWLNGEFEAVLAGTGEIKSAPTAILPKAFGMTIEASIAALLAEMYPQGALTPTNGGLPQGVQLTIDCDIGLEATGRSIPYEWIVVYYREGKAQKAMRDVRARSDARLARQVRKALPAS